MSLPRNDVRFHLSPDMHKALTAVCAVDGVLLKEFCERVVVAEVMRRCRGVRQLADAIAGLQLDASGLGSSGTGAK